MEGLGGVPNLIFARPGPWAVAGTRAGLLRNRQPLVALRAPSSLKSLHTSPKARRQNLRFCRRGRQSRLGSPKGFQPHPLKRPLRGLAAPGAGPPPQRSAKGWLNLPAKRGKIEERALIQRHCASIRALAFILPCPARQTPIAGSGANVAPKPLEGVGDKGEPKGSTRAEDSALRERAARLATANQRFAERTRDAQRGERNKGSASPYSPR